MEVRLIWSNTQVALVEWVASPGTDPQYKRAIVPYNVLEGNTCNEEVLLEGIEQGEPWELYVPTLDAPALIANALRRRGIWSRAELHARPDEVKSAFIEVGVSGMTAFLLAIKAAEVNSHE